MTQARVDGQRGGGAQVRERVGKELSAGFADG